MYQIAYIGRWETIPETAAAICDHDTPKLEALLQGGLDLDVPIQLSEYIKLMPLEIAVFRNDVPMIHFLLEHGANPDLAEEQPLLLTAARCCGPEVVSLFAGQATKLSPKQKERAFQEVRWGQRAENIPVLEQAGITVAEFGGEAFRAAVSEGNTKLARLLLEKGADINYHKPDMVFPNASTAVTEAARHKNLPMVRWLIEQGADITIADKCTTVLCPVFRLVEAVGRCGTGRVLSPSEGIRCSKAESGVHRMLPEVSPKAVIEWAIILDNKLELLEVYYGTVFEEKGRNAG